MCFGILLSTLQLRKGSVLKAEGLQADAMPHSEGERGPYTAYVVFLMIYTLGLRLPKSRSKYISYSMRRTSKLCSLHDVQYLYAMHLRGECASAWDQRIDSVSSMIYA